MCERYNGWENRETWATVLYLSNDAGLYERAVECATNAACHAYPDLVMIFRDWVTSLLDPAEYRAEFGERQPEDLARMSADIGSLWRVDWREVADSFVDHEAVESHKCGLTHCE